MRTHALSLLLHLFIILAPAVVAAAPTPLATNQHQPPLFLDLPATWVNIATHDSSYGVNAFFRIVGATSKGDRMRFEWRSRGKVVASGTCNAQWYESEQTLAGGCSLDQDVKWTGAIEIAVIYTDDQDDREYLVAMLKTAVRNWKGIGKTQYWGIVPDDLLAAAFVRTWDDVTVTRAPLIQFWSTNGDLNGTATLRCTVNGTRLPDFDAHLSPMHHGTPQSRIESSFTSRTLQRTYTFQHYEVTPGFRFGPKTEADRRLPEQVRFAADTPGAWDCFLRKHGKQVRQFLFTVDPNGMIQQSEMQQGSRPLKTLSNVVMIDMKIPTDNGVEKRIRPEAMKRSIGFGVPWPEHPRAKLLQAAFPPTSGLPD